MTTDFERALLQHIQALMPAPSLLRDAVFYSVSTPGKRFRPQLVEDSATLCGLKNGVAVDFQFAVELLHTFSLVHDDLPALDNDDYRRGQPTVHKQFDEAQAVLAGDQLLLLGLQTAIRASRKVSQVHPDAADEGLDLLFGCLGSAGLMGGQSRELELEEKGQIPTSEELRIIHDQKTTALFRACVLVPILWSGQTTQSQLYQQASEWVNIFGAAYQHADDLEDQAQDRALGQTQKNAAISGLSETFSDQLKAHPLSSHFRATQPLIQKLASLRQTPDAL